MGLYIAPAKKPVLLINVQFWMVIFKILLLNILLE